MSAGLQNDRERKRCHLAWHITSRCNLACPHCLRRTPTQPATDLPPEQCRMILESFLQFARETDRDAEVEFSGGNPLLREDLPELLQTTGAAKKAGQVRNIRILGNPETLDDTTVQMLQAAAVDDFIVSVDGLEPVNDSMRGRGSFRAAMHGIRALVKSGIPTSVKFTLVRDNAHQVVDVFRLVMEEGVRHFGMGPLILAGGGWTERHRALTHMEYRQVLLDMLHFLDAAGSRFAAARRAFLAHNRLYALLFHELGRLDEYRALTGMNPGPFGMPQGRRNVLFVVWSDGEVVLRREMARQGRVPQQSFRDIYENSPMLHMFEDGSRIHELAKQHQKDSIRCSACPVAAYCLPAVVGTFGSQLLFAPNRNCWRK
ncbi:MAG: radical SAM protein [Verrucomicrobiia bacterium]